MARLERGLQIDVGSLDNLETILPRTLDRYRDLVPNLEKVVSHDLSRARTLIKSLANGSITIKPTRNGGLNAEITGDYRGLIDLAKENPGWKAGVLQTSIGAGIGFEPMTFRL